MDASQFSIRRRDSRLRTDLPAQLITLAASPRVNLRDLSQTGAQIECNEPLRVGSEAVLSWLNFETFGTIRWVRGNFAGLEFDEAVSENVILDTRELIDRGEALHTEQAADLAARNWYLGLRQA